VEHIVSDDNDETLKAAAICLFSHGEMLGITPNSSSLRNWHRPT